MGIKKVNKLIAIGILFLIVLTLAFASQFIDDTQAEFDSGTYDNTTYNGSAIVLSGNNVSGTYISKVFDASADSTWNNLTWQENKPNKEYLYAVDGTGDVYYSTDLGATWTQKADDYGRGSSTTDMLTDDIYLYITDGSHHEVWRSGDKGVTWSVIDDDFTTKSILVGETDSNGNLFVATGPGTVYRSTDQGVSWTEQGDFNGGASSNAKGIAINSSNAIFIVDGSGAVYVSTDSGENWNEQTSDYGGGSGTDDMYTDSNEHLYILFNKDVYKSTDNGVNWNIVNDTFTPYSNDGLEMTVDSNDNFFIADGQGRIFKSTNYAITWIEQGDFNAGAGNDPKGIVSFIETTNITFQVRNCSQADCSDGTFIETNLNNINLTGRYFQYKIYFSSTDSSITPELYNTTIDYTILNQQPIISSLSLTPSSPYTTNDLTCSFTITDEDAGDSLTANITWYKNNVVYSSSTQPVTNGIQTNSILDSSNTAKNEEWNCTIIPFDGTVYGNQDSSSVTIQNSPPTAPDISITPSSPYTNNNLSTVFNSVSTDADGDNITYNYYWYKDGVFQSALTTSTVSSDLTSKNEVWLLNVTPNDGTDNGEKATDPVTIQNSIPTIDSASISPDPAYTTDTLTCNNGSTSDDDGDTVTLSYKWFKDDALISGETTNTLSSNNFVKNNQIICEITPNDGTDNGAAINSTTLTISNSAPTVASTSITPDPAYTTSTLTCNNGTTSDDDGDDVTLSYKWYKNNAVISSETSSTLASNNFVKNNQIICEITPNDGTDNGAAVNSTTLTISNSAPTITQPFSLTPSQPKTTNDLTCSFTITDEDAGDSLTANITWYKNSAVYSSTIQSITNGTQASSILDSSNTAKNEEWNCTIIPYDGNRYGEEASEKVTIQNSLPTAPNISLTPTSPYTNNDLNVVFNQVSQDNDSDTITYTYQWYKDSVLQPSITGSTVSNGVTSKNEVWLVNVTPNDGEENGASVQKNVTILNSIPSITSASITPTIAYETTTLTASASGWSDLDNDPEQYTYQWFSQDGKITGATLSTLTGTYFNKSDQIYCNVTPYDADDYGISKLTNTVTIQNSLPILTISLVTDLGLNGMDEDLIGSFTYSDNDNDTITNNQTKWYKDDIEQTDLRNLTTISYTNTSADDEWIFSARANDGVSWSSWFNSSSLTILDISQTYPVLVSPSNGTYFNISSVVLTYTTPNYVNMNCTIFADTSSTPTTPIKNNTNIQTRTTIIYNWRNLADNTYNWKVGCTNDSILYNSTIKTFTIDTTHPTTSPTLTQLGVSDSDKDGNIELNWTADSDADSYNVYRTSTQITDATNLIKIGSTSLTSWEDNTTSHNSNYWYAITTIDAAGNENKSIVSDSFNATANDTIKPKLPTNANASSLNGITTIYWTKVFLDVNGNPDELELQYNIWYRQNSIVNFSKSLVNETAEHIKTVSQDSCSGDSCSTTHSLSGSTQYYYFITTIDDANNENLTLDNNFANVTATITPPSGNGGGGSGGGGGGSGGGGGFIPKKECKEEWSCSEWYSCVNGVQARTCVDINNCGTEKNKPRETRQCGVCEEKWQCGDWTLCVNNKQTRVCIDKEDCGTTSNKPEEERDCGLDICSDGIKNYGEVGVDCGGPCRACKAKDFITGRAITLKAANKPNPFLLIPTMFLLIAFIIVRTIKKSDVKFRKVVSALHIPMILLIASLFFLSFFGPQITGLFTAGNETIKEKSLDYLIENKTEDVEITKLDSDMEYDERKARITSFIFVIAVISFLIIFIARKKYPAVKFLTAIKKGRSVKKIKETLKKAKSKTKEEQALSAMLDIKGEPKLKIYKPEERIKEDRKEVEELNDKGEVKEITTKETRQEMLSQIKEAYKLDKVNGKIKNFP